MRSRRFHSFLVAATVALASVLAVVPALAAPPNAGDDVAQASKAKGRKEKKFPMAAADFKQKIEQRLTKARAHMEQRAAKLPADKAKELRAGFEAGAAKVNAEVTKVTSDGTVTKDEAAQVRVTMKEVRGAHRGHAKKAGKGA